VGRHCRLHLGQISYLVAAANGAANAMSTFLIDARTTWQTSCAKQLVLERLF
jgi:hypothetical protein